MPVQQAQFNVGDQVTVEGQLGEGTITIRFYLPPKNDPGPYIFPHLVLHEHEHQPIDNYNKFQLNSGWCYGFKLSTWGESDLFFAHEQDLQQF